MKKIKRNLLILLTFTGLLLFAGGLWGCGSVQPVSVDTTLTVDTSFSGERTMKAVLSAREFDLLFGGDLEGLNQLLTDNAPTDMNAQAQMLDGGDVEITLSIPFTSYNEYYSKIRAIFQEALATTRINMPSVYFEYRTAF